MKVLAEVDIGEFKITKFDNGKLWILRADGEAMEVPETELETVLLEYFVEAF